MAVVERMPAVVMGKGDLYFSIYRADGTYGGELHLGETPGFSISVAVTKSEMMGSGCGTANQVIASAVTAVERTATIEFSSMTFENYRLAFAGEIESVVQTATPVVDEEHTKVTQGTWIKLGATAANPVGVGEISVATVDGATAGDDYTVNLKRGMIYIVPGGAITTGSDIEISYTPVAKTYTRVKTSGKTQETGRLRFEACNTVGGNKDVILPMVELTLSGDLAFKGEDFITGTFEASILKPSFAEAIYINGVAQ